MDCTVRDTRPTTALRAPVASFPRASPSLPVVPTIRKARATRVVRGRGGHPRDASSKSPRGDRLRNSLYRLDLIGNLTVS